MSGKACPDCWSTNITNLCPVRVNGREKYSAEDKRAGLYFCRDCWSKHTEYAYIDADVVRERQEEDIEKALRKRGSGMTYRSVYWNVPKMPRFGAVFSNTRQVKNALARMERKGKVYSWVDETRGWYRRKFYAINELPF